MDCSSCDVFAGNECIVHTKYSEFGVVRQCFPKNFNESSRKYTEDDSNLQKNSSADAYHEQNSNVWYHWQFDIYCHFWTSIWNMYDN